MPRRRQTSRRKGGGDAFVGLLLIGVIFFVGAALFAAVSAFWDALQAGDPAAITTMVVVFLAIGGATAFFVYRLLMRRENRFAARRLAEQQAREEQAAEREYLHWLQTADMDRLDRMTGIEFEHALEQLFIDLGFGTLVTQASRDYGADLVLSRGGQKVVVQAKRYVGTLGLEAVQEAHAARAHYGAVRAIVVTTSDFTVAARTLAQSTGVELWNRQRLNEELATVGGRQRRITTAGHGGPSAQGDGHDRLDPLFARAARMVAAEGSVSVALVQGRLSIDYSRAAGLLDQLADHHVVGDFRGSKSRAVLMTLPDVDVLLERLGIE